VGDTQFLCFLFSRNRGLDPCGFGFLKGPLFFPGRSFRLSSPPHLSQPPLEMARILYHEVTGFPPPKIIFLWEFPRSKKRGGLSTNPNPFSHPLFLVGGGDCRPFRGLRGVKQGGDFSSTPHTCFLWYPSTGGTFFLGNFFFRDFPPGPP